MNKFVIGWSLKSIPHDKRISECISRNEVKLWICVNLFCGRFRLIVNSTSFAWNCDSQLILILRVIVVCSSGHGDGTYPVYAYYNEEGRIMKVEIKF